jgi:CheY-like chemotaxis protein
MEYTEYQADVAIQVTGKHQDGSVLIMDDDELIRDIASSILTHLGYEVTTCASGEEAIEFYKTSMESGTPFLAIIMDLTIPGGLGGKEAAEQILSLFPKACLIVSSGYSNDPIMSNYKDYGFSGAIAKPYNMLEVENVLNSLLAHS